MKTKIFSLLSALILGVGSLFAQSGTCGAYLTWNIQDGILTISGEGNMTNYVYGGGYYYDAPWLKYRENFSKVIINDSVTSIGKWAFRDCSNIKSVIIGNGVTNIGGFAFYRCTGLTSFEVPNSIANVGSCAFFDCTNLTSVVIYNLSTWCNIYFEDWGAQPLYYAHNLYLSEDLLTDIKIPNSVKNIGNRAFCGCTSLTSVSIPNSVTNIGDYAFGNCTGLISVTIPNSVTNIGTNAFAYCSSLTSIMIEVDAPPTMGAAVFVRDSLLSSIFVPCGTLETYQSTIGWSDYDSIITYLPLDYKISATSYKNGSVIVPNNVCEQLVAVPDYGYHFTQWSDGNTENPRTIVLTQDTTFAAEFAVDKSGVCGKDSALNWAYEDKAKTLTITGGGELTENYTFGVEAPAQMKTLIIGNDVTFIGDSAFYGMTTINHLTIGGNVASIGNYAFAECKNFDDITCHTQTVPTINATTFANVGNKQYIYLYVPEDRERAYKRDTWWGQFDVQIQKAETTTTDGDVKVTPTDNTAEITWPAVNGAETYDIEITKDGEVICVLTFNANGQLVGIAFAPSRHNTNHAQQAQTAGFKFTVTGLTGNTTYNYAVASKDNTGNTIDTKSGSFTTTGGEQGLDDINANIKAHKLLRDGQILILRGEKVYTLQGQEVK